MILELLSYDEIFLLPENMFAETFVAKLNHGHRLQSKHLRFLAKHQHPDIFRRLSRLNVHCAKKEDMILLEYVLERCPNFKFLILELQKEKSVKHLLKYPCILKGLTELDVSLFRETLIHPLDDICRKCPRLKLTLNLLRLWRGFNNHPHIFERTGKLKITYVGISDYPLLNAICKRHPITLRLWIDCFRKLAQYPGILQRVTELKTGLSTDEDIQKLNEVCRAFPKVSKLKIMIKNGVKTLMKSTYIHPRLRRISVNLHEEEDVIFFKEIFELSQNLQGYGITVPISLLKYLPGCPMGQIMTLIEDSIIMTGDRNRQNLEIECEFQHLAALLQHIEHFRQLTSLILIFTGSIDEPPMLHLLEDIPAKCASLIKLQIRWQSPSEPSSEFIRLLKRAAMNTEISPSMYHEFYIQP